MALELNHNEDIELKGLVNTIQTLISSLKTHKRNGSNTKAACAALQYCCAMISISNHEGIGGLSSVLTNAISKAA